MSSVQLLTLEFIILIGLIPGMGKLLERKLPAY